MKFLKLIWIVFAIGFSTNSNAVAIIGSSDTGCGLWIKNRVNQQTNQQTSINVNAIGAENWIIGYLSGIAVITNSDFLIGVEAESIYLWMDKYCQKNPLNQIGDGGYDLAKELTKRMHK